MTIGAHPDIVASLTAIRGNVEQHLAGVSRYRAMRSIEETMADIAEFQDLVMPLRDVREQIERQLQDTREYRALCTIDSIVPQLADVLALLDEKSKAETVDGIGISVSNEQEAPTRLVDVYEHADAETPDVIKSNAAECVDSVSLRSEPEILSPKEGDEISAQPTSPSSTIPETLSIAMAEAQSDATVAMASDVSGTASESKPLSSQDASDETDSPPVAALAYNLANILVQSLPPNTADTKSESGVQPQDHTTAPIGTDRAMQEGRAA